MPKEPARKRAVAFIDGQNLFYGVKQAFGYPYPNYDPLLLARKVIQDNGWEFQGVYFYSGIPAKEDNPSWNHFWTSKLAVMGTRGIKTFSRPLRYRNETIQLPDGQITAKLVGQEKGIDIRIALDIVRLARENLYDIAIIFSQDQDLSEVAQEIKAISMIQNRWIKIACAFPESPTYKNNRGINGTHWLPFKKSFYDLCIDLKDYRLKKLKK